MEKVFLTICCDEIPLTLFLEKGKIKEKSNFLFRTYNDIIKQRYNQIRIALGEKEIKNIKYTVIKEKFKILFYEKIAKEAVEYVFNNMNTHDIKKAIIYCMTERSFKESIFGDEMVKAFENAILELPPEGLGFIKTEKIMTLRSEFLGDNPYSRELKKANYCTECSCECYCNADCEGDTQKCTSIYAKLRECNHHCDCWIAPLLEKVNRNKK